MSAGEGKTFLRLLRNNELKDEFDIKPIYKWILMMVFIAGGLYLYIKDIPNIKKDVAVHETRLTKLETRFDENLYFIKDSLLEIKQDIKRRNRGE